MEIFLNIRLYYKALNAWINNNNNNNIFLPSQLAYSKNYLIKQITNMYLEL